MLRQSKRSENFAKQKLIVVLPPKNWKSLEDLNFFEVLPLLLFAPYRFSAAALALRIFFSSSESEAGSSVSYSESNNKPTISVLVSNFDQLLTLFDHQLCSSNCFRLPSYLMSAAPLSDFALLRSSCFLFPTNCEIR